jgi:hypothetical protein
LRLAQNVKNKVEIGWIYLSKGQTEAATSLSYFPPKKARRPTGEGQTNTKFSLDATRKRYGEVLRSTVTCIRSVFSGVQIFLLCDESEKFRS